MKKLLFLILFLSGLKGNSQNCYTQVGSSGTGTTSLIQPQTSLSCNDYLHFLPAPSSEQKIVKVNLIIIRKTNGTESFDPGNSAHVAFLNGLKSELENVYFGVNDAPRPLPIGFPPQPGVNDLSDTRLKLSVHDIVFRNDDIGHVTPSTPVWSLSYHLKNLGEDPYGKINIFLPRKVIPISVVGVDGQERLQMTSAIPLICHHLIKMALITEA